MPIGLPTQLPSPVNFAGGALGALRNITNKPTSSMSALSKPTTSELDSHRMEADYNISSAREAMQFEAEEAQKNRDWQTEMSNTAHQRAMKDLEAAGLNPILAAQAGASTPSGGAASGHQAAVSNPKLGHQAIELNKFAISTAKEVAMEWLDRTTVKPSDLLSFLG